jgi:predicted nucleotidyltransferase
MDRQGAHDPVLDRFRDAVAQAYGQRLERLVLFGSRARGDFRADSDYDVAVFLHDMGGIWDEVRRLAQITTDILIQSGAVISAKPFPAGDDEGTQPLLEAIRRDGIDL